VAALPPHLHFLCRCTPKFGATNLSDDRARKMIVDARARQRLTAIAWTGSE
jgi:hypothetical protein